MKKIKNISIVVVLLPFLMACSADYLKTAPQSSAGTATIFQTTDNAAMAINGIAKMMTMQYLAVQGMNGEGTIKNWYGNWPGNNFYIYMTGWAPIINSTYHENVTSQYLFYPWYYYYKLIGNANAVVTYIDDAAGAQVDKDFIKAQALTYRAYSFMMLAQMYCYRWSDSNNGASQGLVMRTDLSTGDMPTSTLLETYQQIYKDLDDAISLYKSSGKNRPSGDFYSPNIDVAYATYARAALTRQDYSTAAANAKLARANYPLMSVSDYKAGFANPTSEWIWGCYGSSDESLFYYSYQAYIAYNSNASLVMSYPSCISKEIYDKIPATDIRKGMFLDPAGYAYTTSSGAGSTNNQLRDYAYTLYPDMYINPTSGAKASAYAYMQFKIKANDNPGVGNFNNFRSSEMYLIEAEADYFLNNPTGAQSLLVELTKSSGRDPNYTCSKTGADLLNEIKFYRAVELWGEGFDWFDMKRWGDPIVRHTYEQGGNFTPTLAVTIQPQDGNKWTWKIPVRETDYNKDVLPQ